jgi:hypothetical protein
MNKGNKFVNVILILQMLAFLMISLKIFSVRKFYPSGAMNVYFAATLICALALAIILLKFSTEAKIRVALIIISLGICIFSVEILLEKYRSSTVSKPGWFLRIEAAKKAGIPYDSRTRYEAFMDLRKKNSNAYLPVGPSALIRPDGFFDKEAGVYPLGSISNRQLLFCNEHGEWLTYRSDKHGFRNPKGIYDKNIDIVLVGDSFTQGHCVKNGEDIAGWLRKMTGLNVLNVGMGSNGPLIELATIKEYAEPFKPKAVFMFYYPGNDMESIANERVSPVLMKYLEKGFTQNLLEKQEVIDKALMKYVENDVMAFEKDLARPPSERKPEMSWSHILKLYNLRYRIGLRDECFFYVDPLFEDILMHANDMVDAWGGKFVFVYLTAMDTYLAKKNNNSCRIRYYESERQALFPLLEKHGISYIDIEQALSDYEDMDSLFPSFYNGHYNAKGYRVVTKEVVN